MPLAGLGDGPKIAAAIALREVADTTKVQLTYGENNDNDREPYESRLAIQGLQLRMLKNKRCGSAAFDNLDTKVAQVIPSGSGDKIAYSFGLYTPEMLTGSPPSSDTFSEALQQIVSHPFEHEIFSLKDNNAYTSVKKIESIATQFGEGWDYSILKASVPSVKDGAKDATLYAELWTDYASVGKADYMVGGWWLLAPNNPAGDYRFGAIAKGENYYPGDDTGPVKDAVQGTATYRGNAAGLHTSSENGMVSVQRLLGKVTLNADFGSDTVKGSITSGTIDDLTLDGESATGQLLLSSITFEESAWPVKSALTTNDDLNIQVDIGNIEGINYHGNWIGTFQGDNSGTDQPTGIVGVVGGSGGGNSFVASFGARKVEENP